MSGPRGEGPIGWTARHPVLPNLAMLVLVIGGIIAALNMPRAVMPDYETPYVSVSVSLPGATAETMYESVVLQVERALADVPEVERLDSTARTHKAETYATVADGVETDTALDAVERAVRSIGELPAAADPPSFRVVDWKRHLLTVAVVGDVSPEALRAATEAVRDLMLAEPELIRVEIEKAQAIRLVVSVPTARLAAHGLTLGEVADALRTAARDRTGGRLVTREGILSLDVDGRQIDAEALADIPVGVDMAGVEGVEEGARRLRLGDIATIAMHGGEDQRSPLFERAPSMKIQVWPRSDVAPSEMRAATDRALDEAAAVLPAAIRAEVVWDSSDDLRARIGFLGLNAAVGLGLVLLLLTLFLDLRLAIWVAVGIPTAFLGAFLLLPATGATINLVSLFAFILALGLVVDDAIVAGENIYEYRARGYRAVEAAVAGARDIAVPLSFSVITNIIAFLPLAMVPGWYGRFWLWIPVVVTLAFIVSWIEALFVLPGHLAGVRDGAARSRPARALARVQGAVSGSLAWFIARIYGPALRVAMSWRYATIAGLVALLMIALAWPVSGRMGFQLMPPLPQPWINLRVSLPVDAPRDVAEGVRARMLDAAYAVIDEHGRAGTAERVESEAGTGYARLHVRLPDEGVRVLTKGQWIAAFRRAMGPVPEATATNFGGEPGGEGPTTGPGAAGAISIEIAHPDEGRLATASEDLQRRLLRFTAVTDVDDGRDGGTRRLTFALNEMGRSLGFTEAMVAEQVRASFLGIEVLTEPRGRDEVTVRVSPPYLERQRENFVERLVLTGPDGVRAPLYAIAEVRRDRVPGRIDRTSGGRTITVSAMATPPEAASDVVRALAEEVLPGLRQAHPGLTTALGGDEKAKRETIESFPVSIGLTLALMYGALAIPFRSWWQPLIVMAAIPFGVGGAILGHLIMDKGLSVVSIFGMIALGGVVINAALVMIDYANKRRAEGWGPIEAMQAAGERRFRPILLTTLTTFGGLAPMIFDDSRAAAFLVPIAISMGYGILFATVAVMFIVPCLYLVLEDFRRLADPRAPLSLRVPMAVSGAVSGPVSGPVSGAASSPGGAAPPPASG